MNTCPWIPVLVYSISNEARRFQADCRKFKFNLDSYKCWAEYRFAISIRKILTTSCSILGHLASQSHLYHRLKMLLYLTLSKSRLIRIISDRNRQACQGTCNVTSVPQPENKLDSVRGRNNVPTSNFETIWLQVQSVHKSDQGNIMEFFNTLLW